MTSRSNPHRGRSRAPARPVPWLRLFVVAGVVGAAAHAMAEPHRSKYVEDLSFTHVASRVLVRGSRTVGYTLSIQNENGTPEQTLARAFEPGWVQVRMNRIWTMLELFLAERATPDEDCRWNFDIHLFVITPARMYETGRFAQYFKDSGTEGVVHAFYDATPEVPGNSAMVLTAREGRADDLDLAHEFAHYWWDRACLEQPFGGLTSEGFARAFEAYYRERK